MLEFPFKYSCYYICYLKKEVFKIFIYSVSFFRHALMLFSPVVVLNHLSNSLKYKKRAINNTLNVLSQRSNYKINVACIKFFLFYHLFQPDNHMHKILRIYLKLNFFFKLDALIMPTK